ncbi:MAG: polymer-forming cytoskeletal protein, partial [Polyangiales bacterium]
MTAPASQAAPLSAAPFEITALLGRGTRFEGKLYFEGSVRIDGEFHGTIKSEQTLVIGEGAEVFASVEVGTLIVRGGALYGN